MKAYLENNFHFFILVDTEEQARTVRTRAKDEVSGTWNKAKS